MFKLSIAALALSIAGSSAPAATVTAEYRGTMIDGFDEAGVFGGGINSSLAGLKVSIRYSYDTDRNGRVTTKTLDAASGEFVDNEGPITDTYLTINNRQYFLGLSRSYASVQNDLGTSTVKYSHGGSWQPDGRYSNYGDGNYGEIGTSITANRLVKPVSLDKNDFFKARRPLGFGEFDWYDLRGEDQYFCEMDPEYLEDCTDFTYNELNGGFSIDSLKIKVDGVAEVPLPVTGFALLAAFGAFAWLGAIKRSRGFRSV